MINGCMCSLLIQLLRCRSGYTVAVNLHQPPHTVHFMNVAVVSRPHVMRRYYR